MTYTDEQMEQLFTNKIVFGEMEPWAQEALRELKGEYVVEFRSYGGWQDTRPCDAPLPVYTYRLKRPAFAMPEWFWDALRGDLNYVAMDENGAWFSWEVKPDPRTLEWVGGGLYYPLSFLNLPKHPDWRNSLQVRPGYEGK